MAKFITGKELGTAIYDIIWNATQTLFIVCPYINLDDYFKKLFDHHAYNHKIHIIILFGKNENNVNKSLKSTDFEFFKKFLNISVLYSPNLHGKYYANESQGVITSINLYDYSFENNIEFGVYLETKFLLNNLTNPLDMAAWDSCLKIAANAEVVFIKRPVFEKKLFSKNYIKSDVCLNTLLSGHFFRKGLELFHLHCHSVEAKLPHIPV